MMMKGGHFKDPFFRSFVGDDLDYNRESFGEEYQPHPDEDDFHLEDDGGKGKGTTNC